MYTRYAGSRPMKQDDRAECWIIDITRFVQHSKNTTKIQQILKLLTV